jgi:uncharacterized protein GlcG (DUF336 family)
MMMKRQISAAILLTAALLASDAGAQQATVPDQMPFDVPYGPSITADRAAQLVNTVDAEATRAPRAWKLAIAVVDPNGELVYFYKMDQTMFASIDIAIGKARTAARYRRPTQAFFDAMQNTPGSYLATLDPDLVAAPGGIPIVVNGQVIGAIGCSGATGAQDQVACAAVANALQ